MRALFIVQGEGRGHMTQAMAAAEMLRRHGHEVVGVIAGTNPSRSLPAFFESAFEVPVERVSSPGFAYRDGRRVDLPRTVWGLLRNLRVYRASVARIDARIRELAPDVVLNFLEPLAGVWAGFGRGRCRTPVIAVGHQFMLRHPSYAKVPGRWVDRFGLFRYVDIVGLGSHRLALSFYEAADEPGSRATVCPPLLRRRVFDQRPEDGAHLLIYLLNHGYSEEIRAWHRRNRAVPVHCFYDKPGAPEEEHVGDGLVFHRLHGEKFLALMGGCRGVVCTAGFESISEAGYLGKPALVVPVEGHIEQHMNAIDAEQVGLAIHRTRFELDDLLVAKAGEAQVRFRAWVDRAESILLGAMDQAVAAALSHAGPG